MRSGLSAGPPGRERNMDVTRLRVGSRGDGSKKKRINGTY
jgi:hypothetical protein